MRCRGAALIELMLACALAVTVGGAALHLVVAQIDEQRRLQRTIRIEQELRAAVDLIVRDLRRAGYRGDAAAAVLRAADGQAMQPNPYAGLERGREAGSTALGHAYSRDITEDGLVANHERFGLQWLPAEGLLEWRLSGSALQPAARDPWQALVDPALLQVTALTLEIIEERHSLLALCTGAAGGCAGLAGCPPERIRRLVRLRIEASDRQDARRRHRLESRAGLRNDEVRGVCPA
ncbi:MAG: hypothetical protein RL654_733 [Pseudomonadota bacterium]|jgi:type IV pilus assembly protein PilW